MGALGLAVLDGIVSRQAAANNVGGLIAGAGKAVDWFLSPAIPAFKTTTTSSTTSSTAAPATATLEVATTPASSTPPALQPNPTASLGSIPAQAVV